MRRKLFKIITESVYRQTDYNKHTEWRT